MKKILDNARKTKRKKGSQGDEEWKTMEKNSSRRFPV